MTTERLEDVLAAHTRGDWSDRTHSCEGCAGRIEDEWQARFDALNRSPTREEMREFRFAHQAFNHPGWTLTQYHAHLADAIRAWMQDVPA